MNNDARERNKAFIYLTSFWGGQISLDTEAIKNTFKLGELRSNLNLSSKVFATLFSVLTSLISITSSSGIAA
jgi:hypothetical protein